MDQLGGVSLVLIRVAETSAAHLDDGAPALDIVPQLFLPDPIIHSFGCSPMISHLFGARSQRVWHQVIVYGIGVRDPSFGTDTASWKV